VKNVNATLLWNHKIAFEACCSFVNALFKYWFCVMSTVAVNQTKDNAWCSGTLWNLSAHPELKSQVFELGLEPLNALIIVPYAEAVSKQGGKSKDIDMVDVFTNAVGVVRYVCTLLFTVLFGCRVNAAKPAVRTLSLSLLHHEVSFCETVVWTTWMQTLFRAVMSSVQSIMELSLVASSCPGWPWYLIAQVKAAPSN